MQLCSSVRKICSKYWTLSVLSFIHLKEILPKELWAKGYFVKKGNLTQRKFVPMEICPTGNLTQRKFDPMEICPTGNLTQRKFDPKESWPKRNLVQRKIWANQYSFYLIRNVYVVHLGQFTESKTHEVIFTVCAYFCHLII